MNKKNNATSTQQDNATNKQSNVIKKKIRPPYKLELCVKELLKRCEAGLTQLEALNAYGETCLHTTISTLVSNKGLAFKRVPAPHTHRHGGKAIFVRYSLLNEEEIAKAKVLLNYFENKRGLANADISGGAHHE